MIRRPLSSTLFPYTTLFRSLRHYEQEGLLAPARGHNGYRLYDATDVVRAANIKNLLDAGLTTADIGQYLDRGCLDRPLSSGPDALPNWTPRQRVCLRSMSSSSDCIGPASGWRATSTRSRNRSASADMAGSRRLGLTLTPASGF